MITYFKRPDTLDEELTRMRSITPILELIFSGSAISPLDIATQFKWPDTSDQKVSQIRPYSYYLLIHL